MDFNQPNYPYQPNTPGNVNQDPPPYLTYQQFGVPAQQPPFPPSPSYPQVRLPQPSIAYEDATIESLLKMNRGKVLTAYLTFTHSKEFTDKIFKGVIESVGKDHFIIADPKSGKRFILPYDGIDWLEFDDEIKYDFIK